MMTGLQERHYPTSIQLILFVCLVTTVCGGGWHKRSLLINAMIERERERERHRKSKRVCRRKRAMNRRGIERRQKQGWRKDRFGHVISPRERERKSSRYEQREYSRSGYMNYKKNRFQTLSLSPIRYKTLVCVLYTWCIAKGRERIGREREEEGMKWVWGRRYQLPIDARHTHARRHTPGEEDEKKKKKERKKNFFFFSQGFLSWRNWWLLPYPLPLFSTIALGPCVFVDFSHPLVSAPLCHSFRRFAQIEKRMK